MDNRAGREMWGKKDFTFTSLPPTSILWCNTSDVLHNPFSPHVVFSVHLIFRSDDAQLCVCFLFSSLLQQEEVRLRVDHLSDIFNISTQINR